MIGCVLRIQLLGPVCVAGDVGPVPLRGVGQRALLARLALAAGHVVGQDELMSAQLGGISPTSKRTLHGQVSRLRAALGEGAPEVRLVSQAPGYALQVLPDAVDAIRFERRVTDGVRALEDGAPDAASRLLASALAAWRGSALQDARATEWLDREAIRLGDLRVRARVHRLEAEVALGRHRSAIEPLERAAAENPLDENATALLMLALYRSGRQVDALARFRRARRLLRRDLGVEPGPALEALHQRILVQDPGLAAPDTGSSAGPGQLGGLQIQKLEYVFRAMDGDDDGYLVADDFTGHADRLVAVAGNAGAVGEVFRQHMAGWWDGFQALSGSDPDRVGPTDWLAFWSWWLGQVAADAGVGGGESLTRIKAAITLAFELVDADRDGHIGLEDYAAWVGAWGFDFDVGPVFEVLDEDGDGLLSRGEVVRLVKDFYLTNDPEAPGNLFYGPPF